MLTHLKLKYAHFLSFLGFSYFWSVFRTSLPSAAASTRESQGLYRRTEFILIILLVQTRIGTYSVTPIPCRGNMSLALQHSIFQPFSIVTKNRRVKASDGNEENMHRLKFVFEYQNFRLILKVCYFWGYHTKCWKLIGPFIFRMGFSHFSFHIQSLSFPRRQRFLWDLFNKKDEQER